MTRYQYKGVYIFVFFFGHILKYGENKMIIYDHKNIG
jgi:hypothetical protein